MKLINTAAGRWIEDAEVFVESHPESTADRGTWRVAILEVHPRKTDFYIGFRPSPEAPAQFYSEKANTSDARIALRVGPSPVTFCARPTDGKTKMFIELIELTNEDNVNYSNIPLY